MAGVSGRRDHQVDHLEHFSANVRGALALIQHAQQHCQQLGVLQVGRHHQPSALHHLPQTAQRVDKASSVKRSFGSAYAIAWPAAGGPPNFSTALHSARGYVHTCPSVETAVRRLLPPALSWMASMMRGSTSPMWVRSPGPATLASSPVVASTLATTPLSPPPACKATLSASRTSHVVACRYSHTCWNASDEAVHWCAAACRSRAVAGSYMHVCTPM